MKVIQEYSKMMKELLKGHQYNYDHILIMLDFLEMPEVVDVPEILENHFLLL